MRRPDHTSLFDHEHETESDLTQEFWGVDRRDSRWAAHDHRPATGVRRVDDTGSMRALRDGVAAFRPQRVERRDPTGQVRRTRSHGAPPAAGRSRSERRATATIGELAAGHYDDHDAIDDRDTFGDRDTFDRAHDLPLTPVAPSTARVGPGAVDPLLLRLGALLLVGVLLVPVALALRSSSPDQPDTFQIDTPTDQVGVAAGAAPLDETAPLATDASPAADNDRATAASAAPQAAAESTTVVASSAASAESSATELSREASPADTATSDTEGVGDAAESVESGIADPATADAAAERIIPECPQTYTAMPGDSWYGIADAAGVSPTALMAENLATVDTVILAGDDICLPSGATVPTAPPTTTATNTTSPDTTAAPTTVAPTTAAPTTTVAPTTPSGSPGTNASVGEVKDVIRSVFPESEWDTAFTIADRESGFVPAAYNGWCCYGVFQIYWNIHRSWLDDLGVHSSSDLFDPLLNVRAAYAIWQRSGNSWSAWSTYNG